MILTDAKYDVLCAWVTRHYREALAPDEIGDPALMTESFAALDELTGLLNLGSDFYPFQRG